MDEEMKKKLDSTLDEVKDPESGLSISELGLINKFRYNNDLKELYVFNNFFSHRPACKTCVGISMLIEKTIKRDLKTTLERKFPDLTIIFV